MIYDLLHNLAYPTFTQEKLGDAVNDQAVADAFWDAFSKSSNGQTEATWQGIRAALRVIDGKRKP